MEKPLSILFVASEVLPYIKVGDLADVAYSLPLNLREKGHDVRVMLPKYGIVSERRNKIHEINRLKNIPIPIGKSASIATVKSSSINNVRSKVQAYITTNDRFFEAKKGVYFNPKTGKYYPDNDERFIYFCRSVIETCLILEWFPDVIHCNDWQTAIIPAFVKKIFPNKFKNTKTVLTLHNFSEQGVFPLDHYFMTSFPDKLKEDFTHNDKFNILKGGLVHADYITTVSSSYEQQIMQDSEYSDGLNSVLLEHKDKFQSVMNGLDPWSWNPDTDPLIKFKLNGDVAEFKQKNKLNLLEQFELKKDTDIPLIAIIAELNEEKALSIFFDNAEKIFQEKIQFIFFGDGILEYKKSLKELVKASNGKFNFKFGFNEELAHQIEAGADMLLIPQKNEPSGLNAIYSLAYGTVPVVRCTGGLKDIVEDFNPQTKIGTGIVFNDYNVESLLEAIKKGINYYQDKELWLTLIQNGMEKDFSWKESILKYEDIYRKILKEV